ncbi:uncharacterized protein LOC133863379 [Alnus glutinosa]|uniref:uncharacterized protein LOC133863379 n=1 Tax=Alnus glutinosa TaxID=3517 RepID=UPI002D777154|nr:uncharacterized protein LOC133863379 [Alnus glutinosa]
MDGSSSHSSAAAISVSQEEFNMFHTIDRTLFTRLVFNLFRDPAEATQVMALWLWLEMVGEEIDMVYSKILSLPDALLNALVDESVMALACIESDKFPFAYDSADNILPLIQSLTKSGVSLRFFHDNRTGIIRGVTRIINEVCVRAFEDIVKLAQGTEEIVNFPVNFSGPLMNPLLQAAWYSNPGVGVHPPHHAGALKVFDPYDLSVQRHILNTEIGEVLSRLKLSAGDHDQEEKEVPPDDRTIFLTFSKGYPISQNELKDFFTRKFGDVVEAIYMQEVLLPEEQPLYARLIVRLASSIEVVLEGRSRAKFSINGKHVWARKFVRKSPIRSPPKSSPPPSQPTSPSK